MASYSEKELLLVKKYVKTHLRKGESLQHIKQELKKVGVSPSLVNDSLKHKSYVWLFWTALVIALIVLGAYFWSAGAFGY